MFANRRPSKTDKSGKTLVQKFIENLANNRFLYIPIAIILILSGAVSTLKPVGDFIQEVWPKKDITSTEKVISRDTLQKNQFSIHFEPHDSTIIKKITTDVIPSSSVKKPQKQALPLNKIPPVTVDLVAVRDEPFPVVRATLGNKGDIPYTVRAVKIYTVTFLKSRDLPDARILETTAEWVVPLDTSNVYILPAKRHMELPPDSFGVIDVIFVYQSGDIYYKPSDIGQFTIRLSFITDADDEIPYPYDIRL